MSGPGRRRKPNPEEEGGGSLPAPPGPPAGYQQQSPQQQQSQAQGQEYAYGYDYNYGAYDTGYGSSPNATSANTYDAANSTDYDRYDYDRDRRQPPATSGSAPTAAQPPTNADAPPGPVFDPFSPTPPPSSPRPTPSRPTIGIDQQPSYYNPVGHGLSDPYSPAGYAAPQAPATHPPATHSHPPTVPPPTSTPTPSAYPSGPRSFPSDQAGLFDDDALFDTGDAPPTSSPPLSSSATNPVVPPPSADAPRPNDGYAASDFAFLEEETGQDVKGWLTFVESRKDSRADRAKRFRIQLITAATALAVVAVAIGAYFIFSGGTLGSSGPTKSVVLLQVSNSTGNAVADALLVTDSSATSGTATGTSTSTAKSVNGKGAAVLIPSQLEINTTGFGLQPFGGDMAQSVPAADTETVSDTFGVSISGVWRMDEVTFAGLIDEIGGIKLTANTAVPAAKAAPTAAAVPAGAGKLTGGQAIAYGTYTAKGEAPSAQSERFGQVIAALLNALPTEAVAITSYLNHLGVVDDPALPESKLSPILAALATEQQAGAFTAKVLPVRTDGSNEIDFQAAAPIVSSMLGGALTAGKPGQVSRVLVEDATGSTGKQSQAVRTAAQAKLANSGYTVLDGSTVASSTTSVVEVGTNAQKDAAVQIAETLGLQAINVKVVTGMSTFSDVTVILGTDWPKLANVTAPAN